ncbi:MAG: hypothetical protein VB042_02935 [Victivallaceae bacterium]|nr:hypothetical protein [Victivallaceae bacterium]
MANSNKTASGCHKKTELSELSEYCRKALEMLNGAGYIKLVATGNATAKSFQSEWFPVKGVKRKTFLCLVLPFP